MSENQFIAINRLPSKTWYWLKLNETHIRWQDETRPCVTLAENVRAGQADEAKFAAIRTGAGEQLESAMAGLPVTTIAGAERDDSSACGRRRGRAPVRRRCTRAGR